MTSIAATEPKTVYDDGPAIAFLYPSIVFLIIGMMFGVFIAFNGFIFPDYFAGEYVHFGKLRPVHVGHVTLLWLLSANVGLFFFFVPRLSGIPLYSTKLAYLSAAIWWPALLIGVYSFPFGTNFGWEYAELPMWVGFIPIKAVVSLAWVLIVINLFATIMMRKYEKMYVSIWYTMGTLVWTTFTFLAGNFGINFVAGGISKVNVSWFYVHNLVGLIYTPMGLAQAYYFLPKFSKLPIYSHHLSMIGFWTIAFVYAWIGAHHMLHGPMPQWLQTTSIVFSIWLFIPVWTVVTNLLYTAKENWNTYTQNVGVRFIIMGVLFYLLTCIQGPLMALRNVSEITSKTDWVIGHAHISLYATFSFFAMGGIYYAIPLIVKKPLWSEKLANWHFTLNIIGSIPFIFSLWIGGFYQGMLWLEWAKGNSYAEMQKWLVDTSFLDTVAAMYPFWIWRGIGGVIILFANILFVINIFNTVILIPRTELQKAA